VDHLYRTSCIISQTQFSSVSDDLLASSFCWKWTIESSLSIHVLASLSQTFCSDGSGIGTVIFNMFTLGGLETKWNSHGLHQLQIFRCDIC